MIFSEPDLLQLMDIKIFVDTDDDIRLLRRLKRDIHKRGRTVESVFEQYENFVRPILKICRTKQTLCGYYNPKGWEKSYCS